MTGNNPKLDLVNVDVHTKFGQILSSHSQDNEWKQKCRKDGRTEGQNNGTTEGQGESSIAPTFSKRGYKYVFTASCVLLATGIINFVWSP